MILSKLLTHKRKESMNKGHMYGMMMAAMAMAGMSNIERSQNYKPIILPSKKESEEIYYKNKNLTKFELNGKIIYALNYKNALRKYNQYKKSNP